MCLYRKSRVAPDTEVNVPEIIKANMRTAVGDALYDPASKTYLPIVDRTAECNAVGTISPPLAEKAKHLLNASRVRLRAHSAVGLGKSVRDEIAPLLGPLGPLDLPDMLSMLLGQVGVGVFYKENALSFEAATAIYHFILTPQAVGGDNEGYLYLTATNRSKMGVESFVLYHSQSQPEFRVYDWSIPGDDRWALTLPFNALKGYFGNKTVAGRTIPALYVVNTTRLMEGTDWVNEVLMRPSTGDKYDLVYSRRYRLTSNADQYSNDWGPIVETFQRYRQPTNEMGFAEAFLYQDGEFRALDEENSYFRNDGIGFAITEFEPNHTFIAQAPGEF